MTSDTAARYRALRSRDRRWDGTFYVAVRTTRIYCRPVCRARLPLERNCTFYDTAAAAEQAGFRPCLRCRPELAPGRSRTDVTSWLAAAAFDRIAAGALNERPLSELARELCVSERQLRRATDAEFGVSPVELAQTQRLLFAKQLLTETSLPVTRIAFASGFGSVSRFNTLFLQRYGMSPTRLRSTRRTMSCDDGVSLLLQYRPPYAWPHMLRFLAGRSIAGIERCDATSYTRTMRVGEHTGWLHVSHEPRLHALRVTVSDGLVPALMPVRSAVRRLFDLDAEPALVDAHLAADERLAPLTAATPGLRLPGTVDVFELAMRGILGQQVTVAAAHTLCGRVVAMFGEPLDVGDGPPGLTHLPVTAAAIAAADSDAISALGMPRSRARTLVLLAQAVADGTLAFAGAQDPHEVMESLRRIPGIGPWTAEYIAMRGLSWPDAFPAADVGIRNALGGVTAAEAEAMSEAWRPWRAYAVIHLWNSLSNPAARE